MEKNQSESRVQAILKAKMEKAVLKGIGTKVQVSTRINITAVAVLDMIAESTGETRTSLAADLLTAAIQDAAGQFGFAAPNTPEFIEQIGPRLNDLMPETEESDYVVTDVKFAEQEQK
jgi:hypothetical protein